MKEPEIDSIGRVRTVVTAERLQAGAAKRIPG